MSEREMTAQDRAEWVMPAECDAQRDAALSKWPKSSSSVAYRGSIAHQCESHAAAATAKLRAEVERLKANLDIANKAERHARSLLHQPDGEGARLREAAAEACIAERRSLGDATYAEGVDAPGDVEDSLVMCVLRDWHRGASGGEAVTVRIGRFDIESMMRSVLEVAAKAANCSEIPNSSTVDVEGLAKALADWWRDKDIQYSPASEEEAARRIVARDVERILRAHLGQPARGEVESAEERAETALRPYGCTLAEWSRKTFNIDLLIEVSLAKMLIADEIRAAEQAVREECERDWGEAMAELTRMTQDKVRAAGERREGE